MLGVEVESVILEGNPANEIVNFAEKNDIELIVTGTLGKTGITKFLLGSVAENVVRHSKKPVLVVGINMESGTKIKDKPYSQILIATDGSKSAEDAAYLGIKFARQYGAKVYAVYVISITTYEQFVWMNLGQQNSARNVRKPVTEQPLLLWKKQNLPDLKPNP